MFLVFFQVAGTFVPWNFRSVELSFPGTFAPWNFHSLNITDNGKRFKSRSEKYAGNKMTRMNGYCLGLCFSKAYENLNEDIPIISAMKMQPNGSIGSGNIRFVRIFPGVP